MGYKIDYSFAKTHLVFYFLLIFINFINFINFILD
jgi:cbb3-type cytochrome oxidase subunit 3